MQKYYLPLELTFDSLPEKNHGLRKTQQTCWSNGKKLNPFLSELWMDIPSTLCSILLCSRSILKVCCLGCWIRGQHSTKLRPFFAHIDSSRWKSTSLLPSPTEWAGQRPWQRSEGIHDMQNMMQLKMIQYKFMTTRQKHSLTLETSDHL